MAGAVFVFSAVAGTSFSTGSSFTHVNADLGGIAPLSADAAIRCQNAAGRDSPACTGRGARSMASEGGSSARPSTPWNGGKVPLRDRAAFLQLLEPVHLGAAEILPVPGPGLAAPTMREARG